jgi:hypothetical protein
MKQVIAGISLIVGIGLIVSLFLIPGSAFAYWVPDYYGQGIEPGQGPGLPGTQGGYPGDNLGGLPGLPWLGNILSGIFGNPGNPYAPVYGGYPGYYHPGQCSCSSYHNWWYHPNPTWQQGQTSDIQIYGSGNTVGVTQDQGQDGGY